MKKLNHIKLFESFSNEYSAVVVYLENQMAVGVFSPEEARSLYSSINSQIEEESDLQFVEIISLSKDQDLIVCPFEGKAFGTNEEGYESLYGSLPQDVVEMGKDYNWGEDQVVFRTTWGIDGFVLVDSEGGTHLLAKDEMADYIL